MASLSVSGIDDDVYERLRVRAASHGVSIEEEARRILHRALAAPENLGQLALECFGGLTLDIELELPPNEAHEPLDLAE